MPEGTDESYSITLESKMIDFYHDTKTHKYVIIADGETITFTKAKGEAIIEFLKFFEALSPQEWL